MADPFDHMHKRLGAHFGAKVESKLRGQDTEFPVEVSHGVAITGDMGELVSYRSVANVPAADNPRGGDALLVNGKSYVIDSIMDNNGYMVRCVLR